MSAIARQPSPVDVVTADLLTAKPAAGAARAADAVDSAAAVRSTIRRAALFGAAAAVVSAAGFGYLSIDSLVTPGARHYRDAIFLWPWLAGAAAITALHLVQRGPRRRLERAGAWLTLGGMAVGTAGIAPATFGGELVGALAGPAAAVWTIGMIVLGVATIRAKVAPAWAGIALALAEPATIALGQAFRPIAPVTDSGSYTGAIGNALAFLLLAHALRALARHRRPT